MKLSVVIPYYNTNALIGRMLDSLLDQGLEPSEYEIIIVDDGSDSEAVVAKDYAARYAQISYYRNEHAGVSAARNFGMGLAKGDWLYFCDSDDFLQPRVLGPMIDIAEERDLDILHARRVMLRPSDTVPEPRRNFSDVSQTQTGLEYFGDEPYDLTWSMCVCILRRSFIDPLGLRFEDLFYVEDCLFKLQVFKYARKVAFVDVDLYYYMQNEVSILHSKKQGDTKAFTEATIRSIEAKYALIQDPATPAKAAEALKRGCTDDSIGLITNVFRYCPVRETKACIDRLEAMGAWPVAETKSTSGSKLRVLINHRHLWMALCRLFHLLPHSVRVRM